MIKSIIGIEWTKYELLGISPPMSEAEDENDDSFVEEKEGDNSQVEVVEDDVVSLNLYVSSDNNYLDDEEFEISVKNVEDEIVGDKDKEDIADV